METETASTVAEKPRRKRKYTKRGPVKVTVDGKVYRGTEITQAGKFLTLKTLMGSVLINTEAAKTPIEIVGSLQIGPNSGQTPQNGVVSSPQMVGGVASFKAARARQLEGLLAMPGGMDEPEPGT